ncbi:MAG: hypothetical protein Q9170_002291 [Blastenia crenularia]
MSQVPISSPDPEPRYLVPDQPVEHCCPVLHPITCIMQIPFEEEAMTEEPTIESAYSPRTLDPIDREMEKKVLQKCDLHVVPVLSLIWMAAFLDRINIGNVRALLGSYYTFLLTQPPQARIQGLEADLDMKGQQYNVALQVFFIPYILFEIPSNVFIRKLAPSTWLSGIMLGWESASVSSRQASFPVSAIEVQLG